jgi:hypothetical protein
MGLLPGPEVFGTFKPQSPSSINDPSTLPLTQSPIPLSRPLHAAFTTPFHSPRPFGQLSSCDIFSDSDNHRQSSDSLLQHSSPFSPVDMGSMVPVRCAVYSSESFPLVATPHSPLVHNPLAVMPNLEGSSLFRRLPKYLFAVIMTFLSTVDIQCRLAATSVNCLEMVLGSYYGKGFTGSTGYLAEPFRESYFFGDAQKKIVKSSQRKIACQVMDCSIDSVSDMAGEVKTCHGKRMRTSCTTSSVRGTGTWKLDTTSTGHKRKHARLTIDLTLL